MFQEIPSEIVSMYNLQFDYETIPSNPKMIITHPFHMVVRHSDVENVLVDDVQKLVTIKTNVLSICFRNNKTNCQIIIK